MFDFIDSLPRALLSNNNTNSRGDILSTTTKALNRQKMNVRIIHYFIQNFESPLLLSAFRYSLRSNTFTLIAERPSTFFYLHGQRRVYRVPLISTTARLRKKNLTSRLNVEELFSH